MHKENNLIKRNWQIIVIIKNSLFLDNKLSLDFWAKAMNIANYLQNRLSTKS